MSSHKPTNVRDVICDARVTIAKPEEVHIAQLPAFSKQIRHVPGVTIMQTIKRGHRPTTVLRLPGLHQSRLDGVGKFPALVDAPERLQGTLGRYQLVGILALDDVNQISHRGVFAG